MLEPFRQMFGDPAGWSYWELRQFTLVPLLLVFASFVPIVIWMRIEGARARRRARELIERERLPGPPVRELPPPSLTAGLLALCLGAGLAGFGVYVAVAYGALVLTVPQQVLSNYRLYRVLLGCAFVPIIAGLSVWFNISTLRGLMEPEPKDEAE